jgi:hypothetical protein
MQWCCQYILPRDVRIEKKICSSRIVLRTRCEFKNTLHKNRLTVTPTETDLEQAIHKNQTDGRHIQQSLLEQATTLEASPGTIVLRKAYTRNPKAKPCTVDYVKTGMCRTDNEKIPKNSYNTIFYFLGSCKWQGIYPNPLKVFVTATLHHTLSKLFFSFTQGPGPL